MSKSDSTETQVLVIGAGPAGYVAAIRAAQLGVDVTLVEKDALGGSCLNRGCIPSKALISAADVAHSAANGSRFGVTATVDVDLERMVAWKDGIVRRLTGGVEQLCEATGVTLVDGRAAFTADDTARVDRADGCELTVTFEHAIIATGSRSIEIPGFSYAADRVLDSSAALSLDSVPDRLVVIGAGYIGMELSTVFAKLGTDVTVLEMLDSVLPGFDSELVKPVERVARSLDIDIHLERQATGWDASNDGITVTTQATGEEPNEVVFDADHVLVAVGRRPVTDGLGLEAVGIEPNEQGVIPTDGQRRTTVDSIFAVGDVAGEPMLAHKGSAEGAAVAEIVAGESNAVELGAVPAVVFTDPEIGMVGLTASEAADAGHDVVTGEFPFRINGRALTTNHSAGFVRVVGDAADGRILGGQIVGPEASELVAELGLAMKTGATLSEVGDVIQAHPTLSEAVGEACEHALGKAIHTLNR